MLARRSALASSDHQEIEDQMIDQTLAKFAEAIGVPFNIVRRCRDSARAWPEIAGRPAIYTAQALAAAQPKPGLKSARRRAFSIAQELNAHPQRQAIIAREP